MECCQLTGILLQHHQHGMNMETPAFILQTACAPCQSHLRSAKPHRSKYGWRESGSLRLTSNSLTKPLKREINILWHRVLILYAVKQCSTLGNAALLHGVNIERLSCCKYQRLSDIMNHRSAPASDWQLTAQRIQGTKWWADPQTCNKRQRHFYHSILLYAR